jgi:UDP-glucose 4-epimerase
LLKKNHEVLVFDNFSNSSPVPLDRVKLITNTSIKFVEGDIRDQVLLLEVMREFVPDAVIHFAGLKAVGENVQTPMLYYDVNVNGSIELIKAMDIVGCKLFIFSSSATVYGAPEYLSYDEDHPTEPVSPYGRTKLMIEQILQDWVKSNTQNQAICMRYFNPVGAHKSDQLGSTQKYAQ